MAEKSKTLEGIISFIQETKKNQDVTGVRVYIEYPLVRQSNSNGNSNSASGNHALNHGSDAVYNTIIPTIRCQAINEHSVVFGEYDERFDGYYPIETKTSPRKISEIGTRVKERASALAEYICGQGYKVPFYEQHPPSFEILNGANKK